jgi:O-antigen/teichoic acid export membrane protein
MAFAHDYLREYAAYILVFTSFILLLLISAFHLFEDILIPEGFGQTSYLLTILGIGFLFYAHSQILDSILLHNLETRLLFLFNSLALTFNIVLNLVFIPTYGMEAAAIITALSYLLLWTLILIYLVIFNRSLTLIQSGIEGLLITIPFILHILYEFLLILWILYLMLSTIILIRNKGLISRLRALFINLSG